MKRIITAAIIAVSLSLAACGTTNTKTTTNSFTAPEKHTTLLVRPDVELKILKAAGFTETRADWSKSGEANLARALKAQLEGRSGQVVPMDLNAALSPQQVQIIKLNDAVTSMALVYDYGAQNLPTNKDKFNRTLGPGASVLSSGQAADFALMVKARGSYSSGGKIAMNVAVIALGGTPQMGGQQLIATLVDLKSGDIVWTNLASAALGADMRDVEGAERLVESLLKDFPL